jgi:hypothetical protein
LYELTYKLYEIVIFLQFSYISKVWNLILKLFKSSQFYKLFRIKVLLPILLNCCTSKHHNLSLNPKSLKFKPLYPLLFKDGARPFSSPPMSYNNPPIILFDTFVQDLCKENFKEKKKLYESS